MAEIRSVSLGESPRRTKSMSRRTSKDLWVVSFLVRTAMRLAACGGGAKAGPVVVTVGADGMVDTSSLAKDGPYTVCFSNASVSNSGGGVRGAPVDVAREDAQGAPPIRRPESPPCRGTTA